MFYDFEITIKAGTTEAAPKEESFKVTKGVVHYAEVSFPAGCRQYVYLRLFHLEHQIIPTNRQGSLRGEGYTIPISEHYKLDTAPYIIKAKGWSPSAVYNHTLTVRIGILREDELEPLKGLPGMFAKFFKLLGVKA